MKAYDIDSARFRLAVARGHEAEQNRNSSARWMSSSRTTGFERLLTYLAKILTPIVIICGWIFFASHIAVWIWRSIF